MRSVALMALGCLTAATLVTALPGPIQAVDEKKELARQARAILEANCYRCHGKDGRGENGFNYVLNRQKLVELKKVVEGDPGNSKLVRKIASGSMPPEDDNGVALPPLSKADRAILEKWIELGAPDFDQAPTKRDFISPEVMLQTIRADLESLDPFDRKFARYFTLTHLHNAQFKDNEMESYRLALAKLVNSLSWGRRVVVPKAIDQFKTIFRIDLRHYQWNEKTWDRILGQNPYGVTYASDAASGCYRMTACKLPHVRGDWFVAAASRPPLYHEVLELPATDKELEKKLDVNVAENLKNRLAVRAGFSSSGVSQNNRLIERHESNLTNGAYWKSYDFATSTGKQDLFKHPLGPGGEEGFQHDGGEIIFNMPNGLQGYLLVNAKGERIDKGPTTIVSDPKRPDRAVVNGLSCMSCHNQGMIPKEDKINPFVQANPNAFAKEEAEVILGLYRSRAALEALFKEDAERFARAVERTGCKLDKKGQVVGTDPVVTLTLLFEQELDLNLAATEAGVMPPDLVKALEHSATLAREVGQLKAGDTIKRDKFVAAFGDIVRELRLGSFLPPSSSTPTSAGELENSIGIRFKLIPAGKFTIGSPKDEQGRRDDEEQQDVEIARPFYLGVYEVTQEQWQKVMGTNPSEFSLEGKEKDKLKTDGITNTSKFPVDNVSWDDVQKFIKKLNESPDEKQAGWTYRLPTEAEWEYACRGGTGSTKPFNIDGQATSQLSSKDANFDGNEPYGDAAKGPCLKRPCNVGSYKPNAFGIHDMHGNVSEWCEDLLRDKRRAMRGGSWLGGGKECRAARRDGTVYGFGFVGFRLALVPSSDR